MVVSTKHAGRSASGDLFAKDRLATTAALLNASIAVGEAFERLANEPAGLDRETADLIVRISLVDENGLRGVDLADQLRVSPTRISRLADRAEAAGLVRRLLDPNDRRAQRLVLTDAGRRAASRLAPMVDDLVQAMIFGEFDEHERATLIEMLGRLTARAKSLVAAAP